LNPPIKGRDPGAAKASRKRGRKIVKERRKKLWLRCKDSIQEDLEGSTLSKEA